MMRCAKRCLAQLALASALLTAALAMPRTGASGNGSTATEGSSAPPPGRNLSVSAARANDWEPVRRAIDAFDLVPDCAVSVAYSDSDENVFEHEKGDTTMSTLMPIASATKCASAALPCHPPVRTVLGRVLAPLSSCRGAQAALLKSAPSATEFFLAQR